MVYELEQPVADPADVGLSAQVVEDEQRRVPELVETIEEARASAVLHQMAEVIKQVGDAEDYRPLTAAPAPVGNRCCEMGLAAAVWPQDHEPVFRLLGKAHRRPVGPLQSLALLRRQMGYTYIEVLKRHLADTAEVKGVRQVQVDRPRRRLDVVDPA